MITFEKIKPIAEWILSIILRLRLRKTYWSIAVPVSLFLFVELTKRMEFILSLVNELSKQTEGFSNVIVRAVSFYISLSLPWWVYTIIVVMLVSFTVVYLLELKAKKDSADSISNSVVERLTQKIKEIESLRSFSPNREWFNNQCQIAINDLGSRYTQELNLELDISSIFEGLGRTEAFKEDFSNRLDAVLVKGKKILKDKPEISSNIHDLGKNFDSLFELYKSTELRGYSNIDIESYDDILKEISEKTESIYNHYYDEERKIQEEKKDFNFFHKYGYEIKNAREFRHELSKFQSFIHYTTLKLANNPFLLLDGEAGIGKSHLIGDVISQRLKNDFESIFLLGQQFQSESDPWNQIRNRLQIEVNSTDFLKVLNDRGKKSGKRIIIFIDALNEGSGKYLWPSFIRGLISEIRQFSWLGLVLTIRTSYKELIFPSQGRSELEIVEHTHYGFRKVEYEASSMFFDNYQIELPSVPMLHPEFQNPLFLKLFCEGIAKKGLTRIPEGLQGITSVINFFITGVNEILSKPNRFDYSTSLNLVRKSIDSLIQHKIESKERYISYDVAFEIVEEAISKYTNKKGFLEELINEGVISKNLYWRHDADPEEGVYIAYERFEDHLTAQLLIETHSDLAKEFLEGGALYSYIENASSLSIHRGLIDAFSIQVPETHGKEFYEQIPLKKDNFEIIESFVLSLLWRKVESLDKKTKEYINRSVLKYQGTYDLFWDTVLSISTIPGHSLNALWLHKHLLKLKLPDRDAEWTKKLRYNYHEESTGRRLIDWAWKLNDKSHLSDESIKLAGITLAWFHTSTNRRLRDSATKAMICLFLGRVNILIDTIREFQGVNDPYIYERLFAVSYGVAIRTTSSDDLLRLSEFVYECIFKDKKEVLPHILLRDYARGVIEFSYYNRCPLSFEIEHVRPPYNSAFPKEFPSGDQIKSKYHVKYDSEDFKDYQWGQNSILSSMKPSGSGDMYGDFGRYVFESALDSWDVDIVGLSNHAIELIFEKYGYDSKKHGKFDNEIGSGRARGTYPDERIGKKYQWIALYEILARVADNFKIHDKWSENEEEYFYKGSWDPYVRDIDPTILIRSTVGHDEEKTDTNWWSPVDKFNWNDSNDKWIANKKDLPQFDKLILATDKQDQEWFVLHGYPEWAEPRKIGDERWDYPHKRLWSHIRSYILREEDYDKFKTWALKQDYMGRWMPESDSKYELFSREYYWSPGYEDFFEKYHQNTIWRKINDKDSRRMLFTAIIPTEEFTWEEGFDESKEGTISYIIPSKYLVDSLNLEYGENEGEFLDSNGDVICFAANVYHESKSRLLIRKEPFLKFLQDNNLKIVWTLLGEKQIIGGRRTGRDQPGIMEFSGAYYYENGKLSGAYNVKNA